MAAQKMAGVAGLEPTHVGFRIPCLTNLAIPLYYGCYSTQNAYTCQVTERQLAKKFLPPLAEYATRGVAWQHEFQGEANANILSKFSGINYRSPSPSVKCLN